jgi:hypothetical protein
MMLCRPLCLLPLPCRYQQHGPLRGTSAPVVGVLLYRKHVITEQPYILQLISLLEQVRCEGWGLWGKVLAQQILLEHLYLSRRIKGLSLKSRSMPAVDVFGSCQAAGSTHTPTYMHPVMVRRRGYCRCRSSSMG